MGAQQLARCLRIIHVAAPASYGGLERVIEMLGAGLSRRGHEIVVVAIVDRDPADHVFLRRLDELAIAVIPVAVTPRGYARERRRLELILRDERPDVVHLHGYRVDVIDGAVPRRLGIPTVSTVHGFTGGGLRNRLYEWLQVRSYRGRDAVLAVSVAIRQRLIDSGLPASRVHLIRNSYEHFGPPISRVMAREAMGWHDEDFHVGWVGRMSFEKGPDVMLDAALLVNEPGVRVTMVGDGQMLGRLRDTAAGGQGPLVEFPGAMRDAHSFISALDVLVLSSRAEGTPIVLLEAIGSGVPVVTTNVGGIPDVVSDREALIVSRDSPAAIAAAIVRLRRDPALGRELVLAARQRLSRDFDFGKWLVDHETVYALVTQGSL